MENMIHNFNPALKNVSVILYPTIKPCRNMTGKSFKDKNKIIGKFIRKTENTEPPFNAISPLDISLRIELLKASCNRFHSLYNRQSAIKHQRSTTTKLKQLRPEVDKTFFEHAKLIDAVSIVSFAITNEKTITDLLNPIDLCKNKSEHKE